MMKPTVALRLLGTACLLATLIVAGGAMAKSGDNVRTATAQVATVQTSVPVAAPTVGAVAAEILAPACSRKVKVVYAGYGEGDRASCISASKVAAD